MQVHTFIAESAASAVEQIRGELGPNAVVLSVRKVPASGFSRILGKEQIEVLAALPGEKEPEAAVVPDPAPAPAPLLDVLDQPVPEAPSLLLGEAPIQLEPGIPAAPYSFGPAPVENAPTPPVSRPDAEPNGWRISHLLQQTGVLPLFAERIVDALCQNHGEAPKDTGRQVELLGSTLRGFWRGQGTRSSSKVHVFVGPPGSGKSTVLCKWLAQVSLLQSQPARVIQLDCDSANWGALPGMYAEILSVDFDRQLPEDISSGQGMTFIDLPGVTAKNAKAIAALGKILKRLENPSVHLVLNAAYESAALVELARSFSALQISDIILTHLDEEPRPGKVWNLIFGTNFSIGHFSAGQNIPGEFIPASFETLFARQFRSK